MENKRRDPEEIYIEVTHTDDAVNITTSRRQTWRFNRRSEALPFFRGQYVKFSRLRWGIRGLVALGAINVVHDTIEAIQTHDVSTGFRAGIAATLALTAQLLNERRIGQTARMHRAALRRLEEEPDTQSDSS